MTKKISQIKIDALLEHSATVSSRHSAPPDLRTSQKGCPLMSGKPRIECTIEFDKNAATSVTVQQGAAGTLITVHPSGPTPVDITVHEIQMSASEQTKP
ncbi:hypothetical protein ACFYNY_00660 [Streptomyces sp. NPDC006530]|uniref:hypothetical protein n=1 Tax=Streptomyces sp. NPDC006530 TaxID=3364750 RepID=UPI003680A3D7